LQVCLQTQAAVLPGPHHPSKEQRWDRRAHSDHSDNPTPSRANERSHYQFRRKWCYAVVSVTQSAEGAIYALHCQFKKESNMLVRLLYVSQSVGPITTTVTASVLEKSNANNKKQNITGILCQGSGLWMQVLEGERSLVNILYSKIMSDRHHQNVQLLSIEEITSRRFGQWSMALVYLSKDDPMVQMSHPEFDPYAGTAKDVMSLLEELIQSSTPIVTMVDI